MPRSVRSISVNLNAGTAKFFTDLDAAGAKVRQFGGHTVSSMQASSAAIRTLEGNFTNNVRAVERFITSVLPLGPVLQAAFPLVGAIALGGVLGEIGTKVYEFWKKVKFAGEEATGVFRGLNAPLRLANDELKVTNDRLENDIAKLEGKRQNTLKLALDEARVAADRLADSLDKDLANLHKVLDQQNQGFWANFLTGTSATGDLTKRIGGETGFGGFRGEVGRITDEGTLQLERASTQKEKDAAQTALNTNLLKAYRDELAAVDRAIQATVDADRSQNESEYTGGYVDYSRRLQEARAMRRQLAYEMASINLQSQNTNLTAKKEALNAGRENRLDDKPFDDRMKMMGAQVDALKAKLEAIGKGEEAQILAKAFGESQKIIAEVNKALERHNVSLSEAQKTQIRAKELTIATTEADAEWRTKLAASTTAIEDRIRSQRLLTAAIGQGYDAMKAANVETKLMQELGQHANDPAWMKSHQRDVSTLRTGFGQEYDAQHGAQSAAAVEKLNDQIELEKALAGAQMQGAEALRQAALAVKLRQMAEAGATKDQLQAEMELYNAQRKNVEAGDVASVSEKVAATERLTAATLKGAAAVRQAALENKLAAIAREGPASLRGSAAIMEDRANHELELAQAAAHADRVHQIDDEIAKLNDVKSTLGDTLAIEISLRDLENQRIKALAEQSLQLRGAKDGVRAFFLEMQADAKSTASIVYDALHSALDRSSENLAKMLTEKKPKGGWGQEWAKEFQGIGQQMVQSSIKSLAQKGLGELGKLMGVDLGGKKPDGTRANPLWVQLANANAGMPGGFGGPAIPGGGGSGTVFGGSSGPGGMIFSLFKKMFKGGGAADAADGPDPSSMLDWGGFMADGGNVYPGKAYTVGERGQETFVPRSAGVIVPHSSGGSVVMQYSIDARGADLGAHNRMIRGLELTHQASVASAVQAVHERSLRTPRGGR